MKLRLVVLSFTLCGLAYAAINPDYLLQNYHAGKISAEMTPVQASQQYSPEHVKWWEPYPRIHVIDVDPSRVPGKTPALRIYLDRDQQQIQFIAVSDNRYQTAKGIAIGSTFGALKKTYPQVTIHTEEGEMDRNIVAEIPDEGIALILEYDDVTWLKVQPTHFGIPAVLIPDEKIIQSISVCRPAPPGTNSSEE